MYNPNLFIQIFQIIFIRRKWNIFISVSGQFLVTVYLIQPEVRLTAGVILLWSFWQKWNFILGDKKSYKHCSKWNHMKRNICTYVKENDWLLLNGPFILDHPRNEIRSISLAMKSNVNRVCFMVGWNFDSGRLHYASHVNTLFGLKRGNIGETLVNYWDLLVR